MESTTTPDPFLVRLKNAASNQSESALETPQASPEAETAPRPAEQIEITGGELQLTSIEKVWRCAKLIRQSGLCPSSFKNDQQVVIAILRAIELKIPVFQALEGMTVINGRLGIMGDLALALVQGSGLLEKKSVTYAGEGDELSCTITLKRRAKSAQDYSFSVKEARAAGIYDRSAVWKSYPKRMTYYRALGFGLRDEFPDVLKGVKTVEELQDYPS